MTSDPSRLMRWPEFERSCGEPPPALGPVSGSSGAGAGLGSGLGWGSGLASGAGGCSFGLGVTGVSGTVCGAGVVGAGTMGPGSCMSAGFVPGGMSNGTISPDGSCTCTCWAAAGMVRVVRAAAARIPTASRRVRARVFILAFPSGPSVPRIRVIAGARTRRSPPAAGVTLLAGFLVCNGEPWVVGESSARTPHSGRLCEITSLYRPSLPITSIPPFRWLDTSPTHRSVSRCLIVPTPQTLKSDISLKLRVSLTRPGGEHRCLDRRSSVTLARHDRAQAG